MWNAARHLLRANPDALALDAFGLAVLCAAIIAGLSLPLVS
jgi:hypothetical protein